MARKIVLTCDMCKVDSLKKPDLKLKSVRLEVCEDCAQKLTTAPAGAETAVRPHVRRRRKFNQEAGQEAQDVPL